MIKVGRKTYANKITWFVVFNADMDMLPEITKVRVVAAGLTEVIALKQSSEG